MYIACQFVMNLSYAVKRTFLACLLLPSASPALAGEISAVFNGKSYHLGASEKWNEKNYGLGFEYHFDTQTRWKSLLMVNGFRDSDRHMSYMAGGGIYRNLYATERLDGLYLDLGLNAFLMTRKDVNDGQPFPGILPSLTVGNRYMGFNLTYLPEKAVEKVTTARMTDESIHGILFLQFKVNVSQLLLND